MPHYSTLLASAFGLGLTQWLSESQILAWGWRIPFVFGLFIGPVGFYIRRHLHEPECFVKQHKATSLLRTLAGQQKSVLIRAVGLMVISTAINYLAGHSPSQRGMYPVAMDYLDNAALNSVSLQR